jgi:uncharacterized RDD family membrane protein YckC
MAKAVTAPRDPTRVVGRRIAAFGIDVGLVAVVAGVAVVATMTRVVEAPSGTCPGLLATAGGYVCHQIGGHLYILSQSAQLRVEALAMLAAFLDLVVLQAFTRASVGKHCLGLRVVDEQGLGASFLRTLGRWVFLVVDIGFFFVGLISIVVTRPHRRIGDFACGTYVISRAGAGLPIRVTRYQLPRDGTSISADRSPPDRTPRPSIRRRSAAPAPTPARARAVAARSPEPAAQSEWKPVAVPPAPRRAGSRRRPPPSVPGGE